MKKLMLLSTILVLSSLLAFGQSKSQKVEVLWGDENKATKRSATLSDIVGYDDTGIYTIITKVKGSFSYDSKITIEHYNKAMNQTKSSELDMKYQGKMMDYESILQMNKELYLFTSFNDRSAKRKKLFVQRISRKTLKLVDKQRKIGELDYSKGKGVDVWGVLMQSSRLNKETGINKGAFYIEVSRDSSKVLVYYNMQNKRGDKDQFGLNVFDLEMNPLWEKVVTLPYAEELFSVQGFEIDNAGNAHLLGLIYYDGSKSRKKDEKPNFKYQILSYYDEGDKLIEYPIKTSGKFLRDMTIALNEDQDIICAGFYSEQGTYKIIGSYFLKIDAETKETTSKSFNEFGMDFITQNMTEREEKRTEKRAEKGKDVGLYSYDLDKIILREDGGAVLIGEQYYIRVVTNYSSNGNRSRTYHYIYNDIIAVNMAPNGEIDWTEKIAKRQSSTNDGGFYSSYAISVVQDNLYFIFNDNPKNLFYKGKGKVENYRPKSKESLVVLVELDRNGKQTREALFSAKEAEIRTRPKVCEQISRDELVLFGQKGKAHRFAKVKFK